jgi:hypothetical protein
LRAANCSASIDSTLPTWQFSRLVLTMVPVAHRRLAVPSVMISSFEVVGSEAQSPRKPTR